VNRLHDAAQQVAAAQARGLDLTDGRWHPVLCVCGAGDALFAVDRYASDHPPIPYTGPIVEVYSSDAGDPDDRVTECPNCGEPLDSLDSLDPA
jgi:hypothetical protein